MPKLNLPISDQLATSRSILVVGIGGGFDVFCGLPLYFALREQGYTVHLANYSFSEIQGYLGGVRLSDTLVGVTTEPGKLVVYFPELHLANWFLQERQEAVTIWSLHKTGVAPARDNMELLVAHLAVDTLILVDGGIDSLARGDETEPGTFVEDSVMMAALADLPQNQILACIGFGAEREITHRQILENMADLARRDAFLGVCALTKAMPEYQLYEAAVLAAHAQPFQDPSVINASIISAVRGEYGNYHLTEKTLGSRLWISPFMPLYWFYDFRTTIAQHAILRSMATSVEFQDALRAALLMRKTLRIRTPGSIPL